MPGENRSCAGVLTSIRLAKFPKIASEASNFLAGAQAKSYMLRATGGPLFIPPSKRGSRMDASVQGAGRPPFALHPPFASDSPAPAQRCPRGPFGESIEMKLLD